MIYFDHSATELIPTEVLDIYLRLLREKNYNPAARYKPARALRFELEELKKEILQLLDAPKANLIFTSSGTESINLCLKGMAEAYPHRPRHIITTDIEHPATRESLNYLKSRGFEISIIKTDKGLINPESLKQALSKPALAISLIYLQNEFGSVLDVAKIAAEAKRQQAQIKVHLDAVQTIGRIPFSWSDLNIDAASFSAHKFASPKGIGYLITDDKLLINPQIHGGGHQNNLRSGTENFPLVAASLAALKISTSDLAEKTARVKKLRDLFLAELDKSDISYTEVKSKSLAVPNILPLIFPDLRAEALMTALSDAGICVSIGSACSSNKQEDFGSFRAYGLSLDEAKHLLRFSFAAQNTEDEVLFTAEKIVEIIKKFKI